MTTPLTKAREALDDIRTRATAPAGPWLHKWGHVRIGNNDVWECACGQRRVTKPYDDSDAPCRFALRLDLGRAYDDRLALLALCDSALAHTDTIERERDEARAEMDGLLASLRDEATRLRDLVRWARGILHNEELISDAEFADLAADHGAVARLEGYDTLTASLARLREENGRLKGERESVEAQAVEWAERSRSAREEADIRRAREDGAAHAADAMTFNGAVVEAAEGYGHVSEPCDDPGLAGGALVHRLVSAAVEQERARVVDWLRDEAGFTECPPDTTFAEHYASCIESGAHLSTLSPDGRGEVNRG